MSKNTKPRDTASPPLKASDLGYFRLLREFREALAIAQAEVEAHSSFLDARRKLELGDYLGLMLFGLLNPIARTLRGLSHCSKFPKVRREDCSNPVSLGSFSEVQHLVDVIEELPVREQDLATGVLRQCRARLGLGKRTAQSPELRLVYVRGVDGTILLLATNLSADQLSAADVALLYKRRWEIEYYFRWMKCIMGCGHWMAESRNGATIQIYLALIGSLLLQLQLGRRPSKRVWETMQWHQCGMISDEELKEVLVQELASEKRRRESKNREAFWKKKLKSPRRRKPALRPASIVVPGWQRCGVNTAGSTHGRGPTGDIESIPVDIRLEAAANMPNTLGHRPPLHSSACGSILRPESGGAMF